MTVEEKSYLFMSVKNVHGFLLENYLPQDERQVWETERQLLRDKFRMDGLRPSLSAGR